LTAKQVEVLHEVVPQGASIGALMNPANPNTNSDLREVQLAADALGTKVIVVNASNESEFELAFDSLINQGAKAIFVSGDALFNNRSDQLIALANRHALPAIYPFREAALAGGLMSYGPSIKDAHRQSGIYTGRILKGEKPTDLPVQQSTKVEFIINLKTASTLGLTFPLSLLGRADEVIE